MIFGRIPNNVCNLKCDYCYISQLPEWVKINDSFEYDVEYVAKCLSPERLGGVCLIHITGEGETLSQKDSVNPSELLLRQGHFMEIVTNLTATKVVDEFMSLPANLLERLEFKISFHYKELKKRNMIDRFFSNVEKVQKSSCSFTLELMPYDDLIEDIDDIKAICMKKVGALCQVTVGRADYLPSRTVLTKMSRDEYVRTWSQFDSPMFKLKMDLVDKKRKEFCYAGAWTLNVNMYTGEALQCYSQPYRQNIFKDLTKPIKFIPVGCHCAEPFCFNGHAHISLGCIPELDSPSYLEIRNRVREDGSEWFSNAGKEFYGSKLYETNKEYSPIQKLKTNVGWYFRAAVFVFMYPDRVVRKIRIYINKYKNLLKKQKQ